MVEQYVNQLDREAIDQHYRGSGSVPFDPIPLLKMVLYQYLQGHHSPATWFEQAKFHIVMRWLGRGYRPARRTWYEFRDRVGKFIDQVHQQIINKALEENLLDPTVGVQDGTAMAACASRHQTVNRPTLEKRIEQLDAIIRGPNPDEVPQWVPVSESGRHDLSQRMNQARLILNKRIEKNAEKPSDKRAKPDKIQVSLSDPQAPLGRDKMKVFRPLYTIQYVVALVSHFIMSYCCEASATDAGTLGPMIDQTQQIVGGRMKTILADSGYCSIVDLQECQQRNIDLLAPFQSNSTTQWKKQKNPQTQIPREKFTWDEAENCYYCPEGHPLNYVDRARKKRHGDHTLWESRYRCDPVHCSGCPLASQCLLANAKSRTLRRLEGQELMDAQRDKMDDPKVAERYRLRGQTVELAFADMRGNRKRTRFHGRGLSRARAETGLTVVANNLIHLDRLQKERQNPNNIKT
jgi:transposase